MPITKKVPAKKVDHSVWFPYAQMQTTPAPIEVIGSEAEWLTLNDGRKIIDSVASWWTSCHGYNHPHIVQAIQRQAATLSHVMLAGIVHPQAITLAQRLANLLPGDLNYVFYSESGSVAMEVAMKMALQFALHAGQKQRTRFLYFTHAYHGDTFLTMSVCDPHEGYHRVFNTVLPEQHLQPIPQTEEQFAIFAKWFKQHADSMAAMVIEPLVQGCGGMKFHSPEMLTKLCQLCHAHGVLVIMDEIFTGFGRTGTLFAYEQTQVVPDIICLSKALTGGTLPLAVTITNEKVYQGFLSDDPDKAFMHGTTFMGNAIGCAAANASLDLFESEPRLAQVAAIESHLQHALMPLQEVKGIKEVRVKGAVGVIQFEKYLYEDAHCFQQQLLQDGIWARPFKDILYTTPALNISLEALTKISSVFVKRVTEWSSK
jgi:adenosylmethionine-8-amino-7-oxononanoate aminotransferase